MALDDGFIELPDRIIVEERATAFVLPGTRHRRDTQRRMHLGRAVAAACEAVAETKERALCLTDEASESFNLLNRHARYRRGPFRRTGRKMRFQFIRTISVALH